MTRSFFFLILSGVLFIAACGKDDDCPSTSLEDAIVGTFEVRALGSSAGEVEFEADGTLLDPNDALIGGEINGVVLDEKSYTVQGDTLINVRAANGSQFIDADLTVTDIDCDEISINVFGIGAALRRK